MGAFPLCAQFGIDPSEIQSRHAFLRFSAEDEANLERIHTVLRDEVDDIIAEFYAHLHQFDEVKRFLGNEMVLRHLQETQRQYLLSLGLGRDNLAYWEIRLRIGMAHERVGLPQKWYLGAYVRLFELIRQRLLARYAADAGTLSGMLETLQKTFTLDAILAVETYHQANIQNLQRTLEELTRAQQALQEASRTDALTGLRNRAFLMELLSQEFNRSRRYDHPFSILFLDLDHFKRVNDQYGHACGDAVLRKTGEVMAAQLRTTDIVGRFGGEEFVVGLVETDLDAAKASAERIRQAIEHEDFVPQPLTISVGVASVNADVETIEELIEQADGALYRAKAAGRNRVCCAGPKKRPHHAPASGI
jgi:diguanylate cyclase (GGDEF)-like protein